LVGPLQYSRACNFILTVIDRTSKWTEAVPLSDTSEAACAKALVFSWISRFGVPETITSDRGMQFTSNIWSKLCEMLHISHRQTTAHHPESNSAVKRLLRRRDEFIIADPISLFSRLCWPECVIMSVCTSSWSLTNIRTEAGLY
jgi:transposase InsO family protein